MSWRRVAFAATALTVIVGGILIMSRQGEDCAMEDLLRVEGSAELLVTEDRLSVMVSSDEGFTVGALAWILRIGDTEFSLSRYPDASTNRIEFPIPGSALSRLQNGDGIGIRYGNPGARTGSGSGSWFPAEGSTDRRNGFGTLRVLDDCADR